MNMSLFDAESGRCFDCDGHFTHYDNCVSRVGMPPRDPEPVYALDERVMVYVAR